jgi:hypothetical protein
VSKYDAGNFGVDGKFSSKTKITKQTVNAVDAQKWKRLFSQCCKINISDSEKKEGTRHYQHCEILDIAVDGDLLNFFFT